MNVHTVESEGCGPASKETLVDADLTERVSVRPEIVDIYRIKGLSRA